MESPPDVVSSETKEFVDTTHQDPKLAKLTLEMFMNNSYYTKYLSTSDPSAYKEHQGFLDNIVKHRSTILDLTKKLLDHPETQITAPVLEAFKQYASACIKYIELRELEEKAEAAAEASGGDREWSDAESDHELLSDSVLPQQFGCTRNFVPHTSEQMLFEKGTDDLTEEDITPFPKSFWGPTVQKQKRDRTEDIGSNKTIWGDIRAFSSKRR